MLKEKKMALSFLILLFFMIFWYLICYYQLPRGDDVLTQFSTGVTYYLDKREFVLGDRITSVETLVEHLAFNYNFWTGRVIGLLLIPLLTICGQRFVAILSSLVFILIVINVAFLIWDKRKNNFEILKHPLELIFLNVIIFGLGKYMGFMTMWTFVSIYAMSTLLYLILMNLTDYLCKIKFNNATTSVVALNAIGFIAGLTHEAVGAISILMILSKCFYVWKNNKNLTFKILRNYMGLGLGYIICFTAPGNFIRMQQSHDMGIERLFIIKVLYSIKAHLSILLGTNCILGIILVAFLIYLFKRTKALGNGFFKEAILKNNFSFFLGTFFSVTIWSFASYVPSYGLLFYICLVCIIFFRIYDDFCRRNIIKTDKFINLVKKPIALMFLMMILIYNIVWLSNLMTVTNERRSLIEAAKNNGYEVVTVPRYPEIDNNIFTMRNYGNIQKEFDTEYYLKYFGVHIVIE